MSNELKIKAMALFNFLSTNHEKNKRIGELSVKDVIEIVEFLTAGGSNAKNRDLAKVENGIWETLIMST